MDSSHKYADNQPRPSPSAFVETVVRVRYAETDQMGVVYHANYLVWMEVGRVEYCRAKGLVYRDMEGDDKVFLVVGEVNCRYSAPAIYDDEVVIRTRIAEVTQRVVRFEYEMANVKDGKLLAKGWTKHVFCGEDKRPARLPRKYWGVFGIPLVAPSA
jgi:acyl-CoA thioester hydrolase